MQQLISKHAATPAAPKARGNTELATIPMGAAVGAEVRGIDVGAGLSADELAFLQAAIDKYSVVVLRDQDISPPAQIALAKGMGEVEPLMYSRYAVPGYPEMTVISNIKNEQGEAIGIEDAGMLWHTDSSYKARPDMYTMLFGMEIPHKDGEPIGDTAFASVIEAYKTLPEELRKNLIGKIGVHSFAFHIDKKSKKGQMKRAALSPEQMAKLPDVRHPVVRRHPHTGLPCLFVSEGHTSQIDGLSREESDQLLEEIWAHIRDPKFQYRHKWRKGDLVIWDNVAVQHLAMFDYGSLRRKMNRIGTLGGVPEHWTGL